MTAPVQPRRTATGVLLILGSAVSFGAMAIFARIAYDSGADVHGVLLIRFSVAAIALTALMAITSTPWPRRRDLRLLVLMGAVGYVGQSLTYFTALTRIPAGLVAVLFYTYPVLVAICGAVLARRVPPLLTLAATGMATLGVALVASPTLEGDLLGIALAVAAAVIYTGYILAGSHLSGAAGPLASTTTVCLAATGVYAGACLAHAPSFPGDLAGWSAAVATAIVSTLVAIIAFFAGLRLLGAAPSAAVSSAEPVVTSVLAFLVFAEDLSPLQIIGAALVCASVIGAAASSGRRATPANPPGPCRRGPAQAHRRVTPQRRRHP
ncbi:DMT family transporter [Nonomuraea aurantiaca]|uniref:DMT family transporter n=1 Tax=Nonomuraea aurantiaca TaxID=2878562 RepID=UPI001CD9F8B7|nr:DMT family transporter [Nonomuraea aurantiaca]MCA2229366.1 DMT family transporter [Nonomuraea aurantiaca]